MKKLRSFKCECGKVIERFAEDRVLVTNCDCGKPAKRTISAPKFIGNSCGNNASFK